jgi:hypothetical protein
MATSSAPTTKPRDHVELIRKHLARLHPAAAIKIWAAIRHDAVSWSYHDCPDCRAVLPSSGGNARQWATASGAIDGADRLYIYDNAPPRRLTA